MMIMIISFRRAWQVHNAQFRRPRVAGHARISSICAHTAPSEKCASKLIRRERRGQKIRGDVNARVPRYRGLFSTAGKHRRSCGAYRTKEAFKLVAQATLGFINRPSVGWYSRWNVTPAMVGNRRHWSPADTFAVIGHCERERALDLAWLKQPGDDFIGGRPPCRVWLAERTRDRELFDNATSFRSRYLLRHAAHGAPDIRSKPFVWYFPSGDIWKLFIGDTTKGTRCNSTFFSRSVAIE